MTNSYEQVIQELSENKYAPFYFLEGEEPFFIDQIIEYIEENALEESQKSFNQMVVYGKDCKMSDIIGHAKRFPVMAERQVVIVKEAQEITDFGKESANKIFEAYLKNPVPSTILVLGFKYKKLDKRLAITKLLSKAGVHYQGKKIYENDLEKWIRYLLDQKGLKADSKAVFLISENIGIDLSRINNELEKIKLSLDSSETLDEKTVMRFIGISREYNVWEFQKAIAKGDRKRVFSIISYFEKNPKAASIVTILPTLYTLFSKILILQQKNVQNPKSAQDLLGLNYYAAQEYFTGAKFYPPDKVPKIISDLRLADAQFKGLEASQMKSSEILRELVLRILY
ncbi:MAG: DNA polymerase III subunit delta [Cytophagales bacterium]